MKKGISYLILLITVLCLVGCESNWLTREPMPSETDRPLTEQELAYAATWRPDYDYGTCRDLRGEVSVVLFYLDDFESSWTAEEIERFTKNEVLPGLAFLEKEAKKYGVDLTLTVRRTYSDIVYPDEVIVSVKQTGSATFNVLKKTASALRYSSDLKMIEAFRSEFGTDEVVCFTLFNKNGTAYAINPKRGSDTQAQEHCIVFAYDLGSDRHDPTGSQASIVAHEMLHLFGAEDFYATPSRKALATKQYPSDLMLGAHYDVRTNRIGDATAFYIGWTDKIPEILREEDWQK